MVEKYTELGKFLWRVDLKQGIHTACLVAGKTAWVGCADGYIRCVVAFACVFVCVFPLLASLEFGQFPLPSRR